MIPPALPKLTRQEVRELDRLAIEEYGIPGVVLMENAGANTARLLEAQGIAGPVAIACGRGTARRQLRGVSER